MARQDPDKLCTGVSGGTDYGNTGHFAEFLSRVEHPVPPGPEKMDVNLHQTNPV
jgi:hypothetical protein